MRNQSFWLGLQRSAAFGSSSNFRGKEENLGSNFKFPKHKELFNDKYYESTEHQSPFEQDAKGPFTAGNDYVDANQPFNIEKSFVTGGILSQYKKRLGNNAQDIMEQDYMNRMRDFATDSQEFFNTVGKNEKDLMQATKTITQRMRLTKQVKFDEDFRKRYIAREYGNYEKYEKNAVQENVDRGVTDSGIDSLQKNLNSMMKLTAQVENEDEFNKDDEQQTFESLISDETFADNTIKERYQTAQHELNYTESQRVMENEIAMSKNFEINEIQYNGRLSPVAKEDIYNFYQKGMTVKDLSLKYGILPQRVKAVVFQRHLYWNEVYPKLGETHMRLALEREAMYAQDFPFVDYGIDLHAMANMEKGIKLVKIKRSEIDANPPEEVKKKIEASMQKIRCRTSDQIPIGFTGKGGKGYILKELVFHRGQGAPMVNKAFRDVVRLTGTPDEYRLSKFKRLRMKEGGPRYASMGNSKK